MAVSCICQQGFVPQQGGCGGRKYSVSVCQIIFDNDEDMMILMLETRGPDPASVSRDSSHSKGDVEGVSTLFLSVR